ncbi:NfeD family protein, partial [Arthrospira platensis SPKY2]
VAGSIILMDTDVPGFRIPILLIGSIATLGGGAVLGIIWFAVRARRRPVVSGREDMIGAPAIALEDFDLRGEVRAHGELWSAESRVPVRQGQALRVTDMHGLILTVEPDDSKEN